MKEITKKYETEGLTILWKPHLCTHSAVCWRGAAGLPEVFKPQEKPWIQPEGATDERIRQQIRMCPSGALSFVDKEGG